LLTHALNRGSDRLRTARDIDYYIRHCALGFFSDYLKYILFFHVNGSMGAKTSGHFQSLVVFAHAGDKDTGSSSSMGRKVQASPCCPGPWIKM
jgi:hypothetical protein